jgi:hypothetical protein
MSTTVGSITSNIKFEIPNATECTLSYIFEDEEITSPPREFTLVFSETLVFLGTASYRCTFYKAITIEMIKSYGKVIDIGKSDWLLQVARELKMHPNKLKHLQIYFDEFACYEFICEGFRSEKVQLPYVAEDLLN